MKSILILLALFNSARAFAGNCEHLDNDAKVSGAHIPAHLSGNTVIGKGRLQLYSAPNLNCKLAGTFILSGENIDAYVEYKNFTSILYINPQTSKETMGWVISERLKPNGQGIGHSEKL